MMSLINKLISELTITSFNDYLYRNIRMQISSEDKFSDLSGEKYDWEIAKNAELHSKKFNNDPLIDGPFNEALFFNSIRFPFQPENWRPSRFSDGKYGVWYGALDLKTTIFETTHHWKKERLGTMNFNKEQQLKKDERVIFKVKCLATLVDFRSMTKLYTQLIDPEDYNFCQKIGNQLFVRGNPGLLSNSARRPNGSTSAIFTPRVLSNSEPYCKLYYTYNEVKGNVTVEDESGNVL